MYQLTENPNTVIRLSDGARIPRGHPWWHDYEEWIKVGNIAKPVSSPDDVKAQKRRLINQLRDRKVASGIRVGGHHWDTGPTSQVKIMATVTMITAGETLPAGFTWTDADDNDVPMTDRQMVELGAAMFRQLRLIHVKARQHKRGVNRAENPDDYDVNADW